MLEVIDKGQCSDDHRVPLLFIHGACSAAQVWDEHFLDFFASKGYRAVAVSLRGHGASTVNQPLNTCTLADYADDVYTVAVDLDVAPVVIGHSMGCWVVLKYLEKHSSPAGVLMAPGTPRGLRRWALQVARRHPWLMLRANTFGNTLDLFSTLALAREFGFSAQTPDSIVRSCKARLVPESARAVRETANPLPEARQIQAPLLVLGAQCDGMRVDGDASAVAAILRSDEAVFPDMGHVMMLEPGWQAVAERIDVWFTARGL